MNNFQVIGRFTRNMELKTLESGLVYLSNCIAVNRKIKNADGTYTADFIEVVFYGKQAEVVNMFCKKGSRVYASGEFQNNRFKNKNGELRDSWSLKASNVELLDEKPKEEAQPQPQQQAQQQTNKGFDASEVSEDDLPF